MAERRPLVLVDGRMQELPQGDTVPGSGGSASYPSFTGNAGKALKVNSTEDAVEWSDDLQGTGTGSGGGVPAGGETGAIIIKNSSTDDDVRWGTLSEFLQGPIAAEVPNYNHPMAVGNRLGKIAVTTDISGASGSIVNLINGVNDNAWYSSSNVTGGYIQFEFPYPVLMEEITWTQSNTTQHTATFNIEGSDDGISWNTIGTGWNVGGNTVDVFTLNAWDGTTAYKYIRMLGTSGAFNTSPWIHEVTFKVGNNQLAGIQIQGDVPAGGTTGQALVKSSDNDYDYDWGDVAAAGGGAASSYYMRVIKNADQTISANASSVVEFEQVVEDDTGLWDAASNTIIVTSDLNGQVVIIDAETQATADTGSNLEARIEFSTDGGSTWSRIGQNVAGIDHFGITSCSAVIKVSTGDRIRYVFEAPGANRTLLGSDRCSLTLTTTGGTAGKDGEGVSFTPITSQFLGHKFEGETDILTTTLALGATTVNGPLIIGVAYGADQTLASMTFDGTLYTPIQNVKSGSYDAIAYFYVPDKQGLTGNVSVTYAATASSIYRTHMFVWEVQNAVHPLVMEFTSNLANNAVEFSSATYEDGFAAQVYMTRISPNLLSSDLTEDVATTDLGYSFYSGAFSGQTSTTSVNAQADSTDDRGIMATLAIRPAIPYVGEAPSDGKNYVRKDGDWVEAEGLPDTAAASDGDVATVDSGSVVWDKPWIDWVATALDYPSTTAGNSGASPFMRGNIFTAKADLRITSMDFKSVNADDYQMYVAITTEGADPTSVGAEIVEYRGVGETITAVADQNLEQRINMTTPAVIKAGERFTIGVIRRTGTSSGMMVASVAATDPFEDDALLFTRRAIQFTDDSVGATRADSSWNGTYYWMNIQYESVAPVVADFKVNQISGDTTLTAEHFDGVTHWEVTGTAILTVPNISPENTATFEAIDANEISFVADTGATLNSFNAQLKLAGQYAVGTLVPKGNGVYTLVGNTKA